MDLLDRAIARLSCIKPIEEDEEFVPYMLRPTKEEVHQEQLETIDRKVIREEIIEEVPF